MGSQIEYEGTTYAFCCALSWDDEIAISDYTTNTHLFTCVSDNDIFEEIGVGHD